MKKILFLIICGLRLGAAVAQSSPGRSPFLTKSLTNESITIVDAETSGGNISVAGVPAADARLEVYVRGNSWHGEDKEIPKEEIQNRLNELYDFSISVVDHKLIAIAHPKKGNNGSRNGLSISFKVFVPNNSSTNLRTSGGNINLKNLTGSVQEFRTSGGNLDIDGVSGKVDGRTSGGNISVTDTKQNIDLTTSGGNIEASNCQGTIRLNTSGGNLTLRVLNGTIRATTSGGNVRGEEVAGELHATTSGGSIRLRDLTCSLTASTSAGDVDVRFKELGKFLTLSNSGGNITLQLPHGQGLDLQVYGDKVQASSLDNFKGESDERHIRGTMNGGGIPVKLDGNSGRVNLTFN